MLRKSLLLLIPLILITALSAHAAQPEFRGVWVTAWNRGFLTPAEVDKTVRDAKLANMNALLVQMRKTGDAYYKSNYEPKARLSNSGYDPLGDLIEKAHKAGLEVHAWMNTFRVSTKYGCPNEPKHVCNLHPDWITKNASGSPYAPEGMFLDPGVSEVQDYTFNVMMDLVKNYDVDGIHLDYIRYPGKEWGYSDKAVARFNQETGRTGKPSTTDPEWSQWRRDQVSALVRRLYKAVKETKPEVKVTTAVITWGAPKTNFSSTTAYTTVFQDWGGWLKDGIVDAVIPMNYSHGARFRSWVEAMNRWKGDRQVYTGMSIGSNAATTASEIKAARSIGVEGICGFEFNDSRWREPFARKLRSLIFQDSASVPKTERKY